MIGGKGKMATDERFMEYVAESLKACGDISYRPMMGEYLAYLNGIYFGGSFDNSFCVKKVPENAKFGLSERAPYDGAKPMYLVDDLDDAPRLKEIVDATVSGLMKMPNKNKKGK